MNYKIKSKRSNLLKMKKAATESVKASEPAQIEDSNAVEEKFCALIAFSLAEREPFSSILVERRGNVRSKRREPRCTSYK